MKMEIVLTEEEVKNLSNMDKRTIEEGKFNKCHFCIEIGKFLRETIFFNKDRHEYRSCLGCNENVDVAFYIEKEISKKEYYRRFIEQPFADEINNSKVIIMNCGVLFIDEANFPDEKKYFIKQAINPEVLFKGNFKDFEYGEQLDKTLDLTETVKDEEHNIYILKSYYRVYKTLENPNRFSV